MNKVEIHVTQLPYANLATMTVSIPGHDSYRETFSAHPDNLTEASAKLLRRVATDYAALLVKSSTTHEAPEQPNLGAVTMKVENLEGAFLNEIEEELIQKRDRAVTLLRAALDFIRAEIL